MMNPSYVDARFYVATYFHRQGELAQLAGQAAHDGLAAFKIRSSQEYNDSGNLLLSLFMLALNAVPAAGVLAQTLHELTTLNNVKNLAIVTKAMQGASRGFARMGNVLEQIEQATEKVKKGADALEKGHEVLQPRAKRSEAQERGEFEIRTLQSLTELMAGTIAERWQNEDEVAALVQGLQFTEPSLDLMQVVQTVLPNMPDASELKGVAKDVSLEFELQLYLKYYFEGGKEVVYRTEDQDGAHRTDWEGIPRKVVGRFFDLGKQHLLFEHPRLRRVHFNRAPSGFKV